MICAFSFRVGNNTIIEYLMVEKFDKYIKIDYVLIKEIGIRKSI